MDKKTSLLTWVGVMVVAIIVIGIAAYFKRASPGDRNPVQPVANTAVAGTGVLNSNMDFNQLSDETNKITVSIYSDRPGQAQTRFLGSGVIISNKNVLTNAHIVNNYNNLYVYVFAPQPAVYQVAVSRSDMVNDLALLRITDNSKFMSTGLLGNSDNVAVGEQVFAMGNAFGNGNILTQGVLIDKNFAYTVNRQVKTNMRTNISISPGTCGGPLINQRGQIIGINNSIGNPENNYIVTPIKKALPLINNLAQNWTGPAPLAPNAVTGGNAQNVA